MERGALAHGAFLATAGPGRVFPEHGASTPAETKIYYVQLDREDTSPRLGIDPRNNKIATGYGKIFFVHPYSFFEICTKPRGLLRNYFASARTRHRSAGGGQEGGRHRSAGGGSGGGSSSGTCK